MTEETWLTITVADAAAFMDKNFPGWERKINCSTLNISDCHECIMGQSLKELAEAEGIISGYHYGLSILDDTARSFSAPFAIAFTSSKFEPTWVALIKERFNTGNFSDEN